MKIEELKVENPQKPTVELQKAEAHFKLIYFEA